VSMTPYYTIYLSIHGYNCWCAFLLDQEHDEFCRLCATSVAANEVNVIGTFIECLSWCQGYFLPAFYLHHDGTFEYINKSLCIMSVYRVRSARGMLHRDHQNFFCGHVLQIFLDERGNPASWGTWCLAVRS